MARPLRILVVHNYYKQSGGEDIVFQHETALLQAQGNRVTTYTRNNEDLNKFGKISQIVACISNIFSIRTFFHVRKIIKADNIDIVHVHNTLPLISPSVYYAAWSMHVPVIQTMHNFRLLCPCGTLVHRGQICEDSLTEGLHCAVRDRCYHDSYLQTFAVAMSIKIHRSLGTYRRLYIICLTDFNKSLLLKANANSGKQIFDPDKIFIKSNFV